MEEVEEADVVAAGGVSGGVSHAVPVCLLLCLLSGPFCLISPLLHLICLPNGTPVTSSSRRIKMEEIRLNLTDSLPLDVLQCA